MRFSPNKNVGNLATSTWAMFKTSVGWVINILPKLYRNIMNNYCKDPIIFTKQHDSWNSWVMHLSIFITTSTGLSPWRTGGSRLWAQSVGIIASLVALARLLQVEKPGNWKWKFIQDILITEISYIYIFIYTCIFIYSAILVFCIWAATPQQ